MGQQGMCSPCNEVWGSLEEVKVVLLSACEWVVCQILEGDGADNCEGYGLPAGSEKSCWK